MSDIPPSAGSFFPWFKGIINGGSFTMNTTHVHNRGKSGYDRLVEATAPNALHDSGHIVDPPKCHPGTRVAIIQTLVDWVAESDERTRDKFITWVTGAAGAGKSAIGRSVCERCAKEGTLLASFFFGANDPTRNTSKSLVPTISYQICALSPHIRRFVSEFIDFDPLIFTRSLRTQFKSLVMDPLLASYANSPQSAPKLIVVDGLDECVDLPSQQDILDSLHHVIITSPLPIHILVLSRPESNISIKFNSLKLNSTLFKVFLGDDYRSRNDIRRYLCDKFAELREGHIFKPSIPAHWPTKDQIKKLVDKSSGQFVYAKIVIVYLNSPRHRPHQRLDALLGLRPPFKDLPFSELDALYAHLLNGTEDPLLSAGIMAFLALYDGVTLSVIDVYLNLEDGTAEVVLSDLTAIVRIATHPDFPANQEAVLLHKSFGDFLFDVHRSKDLSKNQAETHTGHLVRLIEMFSDGYNGSQCSPYPPDNAIFTPFRLKVPKFDWFEPSYAAFFNSVTNFPMESHCKSLFQQQVWEKLEDSFLHYLFEIMFELENDGHLAAGTYHNHALTFFNLALFKLNNRYSNNHKMHYIFAISQLEASVRSPCVVPSKGLESTFHYVKLHHTFLIPLSDEEKSLIISKAAVHCLDAMADATFLLRRAELRSIGEDYRKFTQKREFKVPKQGVATGMQCFPHDFRSCFVIMLPKAARYHRLIDLCRYELGSAKTLINPPQLRLLTHHEMTTYLNRVRADSNNDTRAASDD